MIRGQAISKARVTTGKGKEFFGNVESGKIGILKKSKGKLKWKIRAL